MPKQSAFCITTSRQQAAHIVACLKQEGFSNHHISALFPDTETSPDPPDEPDPKSSENAAAGAGSEGLLSGPLGWLAGAKALAIPGVGSFIAAGPLVDALRSAAVEGVTGGLIGLGMPEYAAKRYEGKVKARNILITVHAEHADGTALAQEIFDAAGALDISTSRAPAPSRPQGGAGGLTREQPQPGRAAH